MSTYHTNFRLFFHKVSLIINTLFPPLHLTVCWSSKPLWWSVGSVHA